METSGSDPRSALFPEGKTPPVPGGLDSESYASAEQIAADLRTVHLAEFRYGTEIECWEGDLSLLSEIGWVSECEKLVEKLVQLREVSPLDVVAVCALTDGVPMRPFLFSVGVAMRKLLQRVVLLDCDLRAPSLHTVAGGEGLEGFIDMVKYGCSFFAVSRETDVSGLYVIGAGSHSVSSEGELVGKDLERAFNSLRTKSDIALACVPPLLQGRRLNPILGCVDGALICLNRSSAKRSRIVESFTRLWQSDVPLVGTVNLESRDFEERRTLVLGLTTEAGEPGQVLDESRAGDREKPRFAREAPGTAPGTDVSERIELEFTPECRPLLPDGDDTNDSGKMFGAPAGAEAKTGIAGPGCEEGADRAGSRGAAKRRPWSRVRSVEARFLERELFGQRRISSRLAFLVGLPLVLVALVAVAVVSPRLVRAPSEEVDSNVMRSILLPGSDGIVGAGEVERAQVSAPPVPKMHGAVTPDLASGIFHVHVSSHKMYENALEDSGRVAGAGFRVSIQFVQLSELGQWYRVLAGPFHTATAAQSAASRIEPMGLVKKVRIIQEGVSQ